MAKYSYEFKKKVVLAYINGEGGIKYLADKYGIPHKSVVKNYHASGDEGLMRSRQNQNYSFEYKFSIVELYLSSEMSVRELAIQEEIRNPAMITTWVNRFRAAGPDALRQQKKDGRNHWIH